MGQMQIEPGIFVLPASARAGGSLKNAMGHEFSRLLQTEEWRGRRDELRAVFNDSLNGMFNENTGNPVVYLVDLRVMSEETEGRIMQALPWGGKAGGCPTCLSWLKDKKELARDPTEDTEPDR